MLKTDKFRNLSKSDTAKFKLKKPENSTVSSEIKNPQTEVERYEIKKPQHDVVKSKIKKPEIVFDKPKRQRPNYFVAIQISDPQIIKALNEVQQHVLNRDQRLKESMKQLTTLHMTLMVMHIGDTETYERALYTLERIHKEHDDDLSKNPLKLEFKGLSHFRNKVLYAKLVTDDSYNRLIALVESVRKHYANASIFSTDTRTEFTPHLTVVNVQDAWKNKEDYPRNSKLPRSVKIDPLMYEDFNQRYFGTQEVKGIQLLSMVDPMNEFGYYSGDTIYFSDVASNDLRNYSNKVLETEETNKVQRDYGNKIFETEVRRKVQNDYPNKTFETEEARKVQLDYHNKMLETEETKKSIIRMINSLMK